MRRSEALAQLRYHWGDVYTFALVGGRYTATAKFGKGDVLDADDGDELLRQVRRHYGRDMLQERCST
jgi:hypothetical protein